MNAGCTSHHERLEYHISLGLRLASHASSSGASDHWIPTRVNNSVTRSMPSQVEASCWLQGAELHPVRTDQIIFRIVEKAVQGSSRAYMPLPHNGSHQVAPQTFRRFAFASTSGQRWR